mmetsp:Transcript_23492/g.41379  ORF Transcript_23492/g.41379 Transcript_23492/m.41379 type:complete len:269 (-) Transcript_23492:92-898(-)
MTRSRSARVARRTSIPSLPGGHLVVLAGHEFLGGFHSHRRVATIGIRANGFAELFVQGRAADQYDVVVANALFDHRVDHNLHVGHRRRQQSRHADDVGPFGFHRFEVVFDRVVDAKVDHLETGPFHHHRNKVLADVVDVAFDCADDHLAHAGCAGFGQQRFQDGHATFHCVGGQQHFGHKQNPVAEVRADDRHSAHKGFGQDIIGLPFALQQNVDPFFDLFLETVVKIVKHLVHKLFVVELCEDDIVFVCHGRTSEIRCDNLLMFLGL